MAGKMITCKDCGATISKSAKTCPKCGAKQKKHTVLGVVLVILGILIFLIAIGGDSDSSQSKSGGSTPNQSQKKSEKTSFGVGEKASLNNVDVTLVNVSESGGSNFMVPSDGNTFVVCEFEIENKSDKDISVSSILSFEAYADDYSTSLSIGAITSSEKSQLDGSIAAGKKMNGVIGYEVPQDWSNIEIRFTPDFWDQKDITFVYSK